MQEALFPELLEKPKKEKKEYDKVWMDNIGWVVLSTPFNNCDCMAYHCNNCFYYKRKEWDKENN